MKIKREAKIGLFVVICLATFFWGLNFLKGRNIFNPSNIYYAVFSSVDGLKVTNNVMISGFKVGTVKTIGFKNSTSGNLIVALQIEKKYSIPKGTVAKLVSADLMGGKAIRLDQSISNEFHSNGDTIQAAIEVGLLDQVAFEIGPIKDKAVSLMSDMEKVMESVTKTLNDNTVSNITTSIASLKVTLANIEKVSASMEHMVNDENGKLRSIISNAQYITENLKGNTKGLDNIINNISAISDTLAKANLANTFLKADSALLSFNQIVTKINAGQGSIGALLNNDTLYLNLEQSAKNLELLLYDMKVNPKRYINISLIDFSRTKYSESKNK